MFNWLKKKEKEIMEFDKSNNLIHYKHSDGYEYWHDYDKNNNPIYLKDSRGLEFWYKYDKNGNLIYWGEKNV